MYTSDGIEFPNREEWIAYETKKSKERKEQKKEQNIKEHSKKIRENAIENRKKAKRKKSRKQVVRIKKAFLRLIFIGAGAFAVGQAIKNKEVVIDIGEETINTLEEFFDEHIKSDKSKALDYVYNQYYDDIIKYIDVNKQSNGNYIVYILDPNFTRKNTNDEDVNYYIEEKLEEYGIEEGEYKNTLGYYIMTNAYSGDREIAEKYYDKPSKEITEEFAKQYDDNKNTVKRG